eukprot:4274981-Alexandrium_andersonii.AAC.1
MGGERTRPPCGSLLRGLFLGQALQGLVERRHQHRGYLDAVDRQVGTDTPRHLGRLEDGGAQHAPRGL